MNSILKLVGKNLKDLRKKHKLTQEQLAEKLDLDSRQISRIESGVNFISAKTLEKLCTLLEITPADLFKERLDCQYSKDEIKNNNYLKLKSNIEEIASDNSRIEFMNFAFDLLSNKEAIQKLQVILKGLDEKIITKD